MSKDGAARAYLGGARCPRSEHPLLQVSWVRHKAEPYVNGVAHYVSKENCPQIHLCTCSGGQKAMADRTRSGCRPRVCRR